MFLIDVEARAGQSGLPPGNRLAPTPALPQGRPDLQIETSNPLGNGNPAVLCSDPNDGVSSIDPPDFGPAQDISNALTDFGCRFGIFDPSNPCTLGSNGLAALGSTGTSPQVQYCFPGNFGQVFPPGDTLLTVQVRDSSLNVGPTAQVVVRVVTPAPPP